jgi:PKD-like domain/PKD domain/CHU_C Type IX secretion signal domain/Ig-like domain CHU_C associated
MTRSTSEVIKKSLINREVLFIGRDHSSSFEIKHIPLKVRRFCVILSMTFLFFSPLFAQPVFQGGTPSGTPSPISFTLNVSLDRPCNVYYCLFPYYVNDYSGAQTKAWSTGPLFGDIMDNGTINYTSGTISRTIMGVSTPMVPNHAYGIRIVAEDPAFPGVFSLVYHINFNTPPCTTPDFLSTLSEAQVCVNKGAVATYNLALFSGDQNITGIYNGTTWTFDWGDGTTGSYTSTADNNLPPIALRTHTYPSGSSCNYIFSNTVTNPCGGRRTVQYVAVVHGRDVPSDGDGYLKLIDNLSGNTTVQVCEGTQTIVTIKDNSKWDCLNPTLPVGFSPIANTSPRNLEWLYGQDPTGAITNNITGTVAIGGGLGNAPATSTRISPSPYGPSSLSQTITIPATAVAGQYFRVYLKNWNKCNWTDPEYASTYIDIQVMSAPPAPTAPNKGICMGGDRTLTVTSAPVGTLTWYSDAGLTTVVGTGTTYVPTQTAIGSYPFWVTDKSNTGLMCRSAATNVTLTIMAVPATPTISFTSSTGNTVICCDPLTQYVTLTATATGTTYRWYKNGIFTGLVTPSITLKNAGEGGNYTVSAVSAGPSFCESPQSAATAVTILALTDLAQPVPTTVCEGSNAYFTASSTDLTIQRWQWQFSTDNGVSWGNCGNGKYNGFNTNALTVVNTPFTFNNYQYRVYIDTHHAQGDCRFFSNAVLLTVNQKPVVTPGAVLAAICQGGTTLGLGGSITGSYLSATWSTPALGTFAPNANTLNATWTPPAAYSGTAVLTLSADGGVCGISSASKTQLVYPTAKIITQPADKAVCVGNNTTFTVVDDGTATITGRQWRVSTAGIGGPYTNITNGGIYSGATTATLTLTNVTAGYTGFYYQCLLTTTGSCTITSGNALLTVNPNPVITQVVSDQTICSGNPATITMTNSVAAPLTSYQLRNGVTNIGAPQNGTGGTLTFTASPEVTTTYNILATIVSSGCSLQVTDQAIITVNPSPTPVITGNTGPCATVNANYSTPGIAGHTYLWTIDPSGTILTPITAASIDVRWAAQGAGWVKVTETTTATGCVTAVTKPVTINPGPPAVAPVITGPDWTCQAQTGVLYTVVPLVDASDYQWTVPPGALIVSGQGTTSLTIDFPGVAVGPAVITVRPGNGCGPGLLATKNVDISASLTANISGGTSPICYNTNPGILTAIGGGGPPAAYTYQWFKDGVSLPGENSATYDPGDLIANASFYCLINSIFTCGPVSTPVINIVVPGILTANIGGGATPICYNTNPGVLTATGGGGLGAGSYTWLWYKDGATTGVTTQTYDPGLLTASSSFYCAITSATCGTVNTPVTTITVPGVLAAAISGGVSPICYFTDPGILTANASGGSGFYTYLWFKDGVSTGFTDQTYDPGNLTATASFYCQVTSGTCGTVLTATITITVPGVLTAGITGGVTPLCYNASPGTFTVSATGGTGAYSYMWYKNGIATGATGLNYAPGALTSTSTIYCAVTSGACGTVNSSATTITVFDDLTATLSGGTSPICYNTNPGVMTANAAGATGTYTYLWYKDGSSTGVTTQTYNPGNLTASATYYCAVTSGACGTVNTATSTIVVYNNLAASISGGISTICYNTSPGLLTAVASGGTGTYSYLWYKDGVSTGITFQTYNPGNLTNLTNVFYCEVTSGTCGTAATAHLTVNVPGILTASISGGTPSICYNTNPGMLTATGTGGINVYSYLWFKNGISTGVTTANYDPGNMTSSSSYYCAITSGTCGTVNSTPVTSITVNPNPSVSINNPATVCSPVTVDLTQPAVTAGSTAGLTFTYWTNAICTVPYATPATATTGTYYIKGTTAAGCFDIKPVVVTVNPTPTLVITSPAAVCAPATIDITAAAVTAGSTAGLTLSYWTDAAATTPYFLPTVATAGTYYIKGTTPLGCYNIKPVVVTINPKPVLTITNPVAVCSPATIDITAAAVTAGSTAGLTLTYWTDGAATVPFATPGTATTGTYYIKGITAAGCLDIKAVVVTVNPTPTLVITNPAQVCSPSTVNLTAATVTAGSTPGLTLTYWTDAMATVPFATPATAASGTYYIKGTTAAGCLDIKSVVATVNPTPTVTITTPAAVCSPASVNLTAPAVTAGSTAGLTYSYWTDAGATVPYFSPTVASAGTYYIKGTTAAGCYDIKQVIVTVNPTPIVVINTPAAVCSPATVNLTAVAVTAGSTAGLTFTYWTDAGATFAYGTPAVATTGTYYIKGTTAAGCYDIKPVVVTVNPTPALTITNPAAACSPSTTDLTLAAVTAGSTAGLTLTYWTNALATLPYATPATAIAGTYYIKGTTAAGCYDIKPVTVTVNPTPTLVITTPAAVCSPATVNLTAPAVTAGSTAGLTLTYWTDAVATLPYFSATVATAGTYWIKGTTAAGCYDIKFVVVTVNPTPALVITNPGAICSPGTIDITLAAVTAGSTAGLTLTYWTDAAATIPYATPVAATTGTYYIKGTTAAGCSDIKPVIVTINPTPTLVITNPAAVCSPATVNLTQPAVTAGSTGGLTLTYWTDALATIPYATPGAAATGTYYIKGTTAAGCFDIKAVTATVNPTPTVSITTPAAVCSPSTVNLTAPAVTAGSTAGLNYSYWTDAGATVPYFSPTVATIGTYYIKGTTGAGCYDIKQVIVTVNPTPTVVTTNPAAVCSPLTVNLTAGAVTAGSTAGLIFTYWTDAAATIAYGTPATASTGTYYIKGTTAAGCSDIKPVVVTVNPTPTLTITNPAAVCSPSTADITAAAVTAGSTPGLTYSYWSDAGATVPFASPAAASAGTYYIKGTTAAGCFDIKPVVVTVNPTPALTITNPATVCSPATVDITQPAVTAGSTGGLTLTYWTDALATVPYAVPANATTGTYYIKGTTAPGCYDIKAVTVTVNPKPTLVITNPAAVCSPAMVDLTQPAITAGSTAGLTLTYWTDALATVPYVSPATAVAGTYYIKGTTAAGCVDIKAVVATINPTPTVVITNPAAVCSPSTADITTAAITAGSTAGLTYSYWTDLAATLPYLSPAAATAGNYYIKGTTAADCYDIKQVTVTVNPSPTLVITNPAAVCSPGTANITTASVTAGSTAGLTLTYWTNALVTVPYATPATAMAGTYYIKGTTVSGCYDIRPVTVTVNPTPTVTITNPAAVCAPATVDITAAAVSAGSTPALTYTYWSDAGATIPYFLPTMATAGTYYVKGTTALGCYDIKPVVVTINPKPTLTITNPGAICSPGTIDITVPAVTTGSTAGLTLTYWTNALATLAYASPAAATSGTYYIKGTTALGCSDIQPVTVAINPTPTLVITNPAAVCSPALVNITAAAVTAGSTGGLTLTYWTDALATVPYATPSTATTGIYYIKGTTAAGCFDIKAVTATVNPTPAVVITTPAAVCSPLTVNLTAPAVTAGSTGGLTFSYWTDAGATVPYFSPTVAIAGTYYIKGATAAGCYDIKQLIVTVNPTPTLVITNPAAVCSPLTADITAAAVTAGSTAGLTLTYWTDAAATVPYGTPATSTAGTYYIKGTTAAGCYQIKPVSVTINPTPTLVITNPAAVCSPSAADITQPAVTAGSTAGLTFTYWTNVLATIAYATPATATAGTYYIKGTTAAGCFDIKSVTVTVNPAPTLVITNPAAVCSSSTVDITVAAVTAGSTAGLTLSYWTDAIASVPYATPANAPAGTYYIKGTTVLGCYEIKPVTVTFNPDPTVVITNPVAVCSPLTVDITAAAVTAGSTAGLTFTYWTDAGATLAYATPATAIGGIYYIKGTTVPGCYDIKAVTVTLNTKPTLVITNPAAVCSPATVDITVAAVSAGSTPGLTYSYWSDALATVSYGTPVVATAGSYYIKGTTAAGCYDIKAVLVTVNPTPTLVITNPAAVCSPSTVNLTLAAVTAGSTAGLTLTYWTDAAATIPYFSATTAIAGIYWIKGTTAAGCYDIKSVTATVNPTPTLIITNPGAICSPGTVDITAAAVTAGSTGGLTITYWTDAAATLAYATPAAATNGTYYIKGTTGLGCYDIKSITVTVNPTPTLLITNPAAVCSPATVNLTAAAVTAGSTAGLTLTYWTDALATTPYATPSTAVIGTYYIKGTTAAGCFDIKAVTATVNPAPTVTITAPAAVCSPSTVDLTLPAVTAGSTAGLTFSYWTDAGATVPYFSPTVATAGIYYIKGTTAAGCYDIKQVIVTVNPTPSVVTTNPAAVCSPTTVNLTLAAVTAGSTGGLTFTYWTDAGATTPYATPAAATGGTWYIKGTTAAGCFDIKPVTVTVNPTPTLVITNPGNVCSPATADITAPAVTTGSTAGLTFTYWTDAGATTPYATPTTAPGGTYYIKGTAATGCFDIKVVTVTVNPTPALVITNPGAVCSPLTVDITAVAVTAGSTAGLTLTYWTNALATIPYGTPATATAGTYYIKGTTAPGCYDINAVTVTVNPKPTLVITNPAEVCSPSTVDITVAAVTAGSTAGIILTYWTDALATTPYATPATAVAGTYYIKGTTGAGCFDIKTVTVTINPTPTLVITNPAAICSPSTADITAAAVTAGSTAGLTYSYWTDLAATTPYLSPASAAAGTYYIKGTTAAGCFDIKAVTVTVNPKPTLIITTPAAVCSPSTVDITAAAVTAGSTAGLTLTYWTDALATASYATPTTASAGTYYIKGTTALGCYDIRPVTVTVNPVPTVVITSPAAVCAPATVDITAAAVTAGSTAGLSFTYWTDAGATTPYFLPTMATAGTYYVKGTTALGCSDIKPVVVTINPTPTLTITNPGAICSPATIDITVPAVTAGSTAGLTLTYWTDALATAAYATPAAATSGTYYIKGTTALGCSDIKPVTVTINPIPTLVITNPAAVCSPATINITAASVTAGSTAGLTLTYWADALATVPYATPATAASGTYYIKGTTAAGCFDIKAVTVTINPTPTVLITNPAAVCSPSTVNLTAPGVTAGSTAGLTFSYWTDAGATVPYFSPTVATAGTYYVKGITPTGCYDIKSVLVTVNPGPTVVITNPAAVCSPLTINISAAAVTAGSTAGLTFTYWTDAAATIAYGTPVNATAGTYYIKGTTAAGCFEIKPVTATVNPVPTLVITNPSNVCSPSTANLTAATVTAGSTLGLTLTYWTDALATVSYATPANAPAGTYYIKGTTAAGCFDIKSVTVTINPTPALVITNPAAICSPSTADLTAAAVTAGSTAGLSFSYWLDAAMTTPYFSPTVATAGTYYLKGTAGSGCFDVKPVLVTVNPKPVLVISDPPAICSPSTVNITLAGVTAGSTAGLTLTYWSDALATVPYATPATATTGTYYIKGTTGAGCFDIKAVTITVNPTPTVLITNPAAVCSPSTVDLTQPVVTAGSTAGLTFTYWTNALATISYGTPTLATAGTYYIKGTTAPGCFDIKAVTVTVNPTPTVVVTNPVTVCFPSTVNLTAAAVAAGSSAGLTFTYWTDALATTPYFSATVATAGTYYIKGTTALGCFDIKPVTVTVDPIPTLVITNPAPVCPTVTTDITAAAITAGSTAGLTFTYWTNAGATISYATLTAAVAGTYYIKGTIASGCYDIKSVTVTTNPVSSITDMTVTMCSGATFTTVPVDGINGTVLAGTIYNWPAPVVTGGITGGLGSGGSSANITGTLVNPTNTVQTATYTITPLSASCTGPTFKVTVTVNPKPAILPQTANICSGGTFSVTPLNVTDGVVPAFTTYSWSAPAGAGFTGGSPGSGASVITGMLSNLTSSVQIATYSITPQTGACSGTPFTLQVNIDPAPAIMSMATSVCSGVAFTVTPLNGANGIVPPGTIYSWAAPAGAGFTGGAAGSSSPNITGTITNTTSSVQPVAYTVTPVSGACTGTPFQVIVNVNPKPAVSDIIYTVCSGVGFTVAPVDGVNGKVPAGTTYSWTAPSGTGFTGRAPGSIASQLGGTLFNSTNTLQTATYTVTPVSGSCTGSPIVVTVNINPAPVISNMTEKVCSGVLFTLTPADITNGVIPAGTTYSWSAPSGTGFTGGLSGSGLASISGTLSNSTSAVQTATYTVTPVSGSCTGPVFTVTITVKPLPAITTSPVNKTACEFTMASFSATGTGTDLAYQWYVDKNDGAGFNLIPPADGTYFGSTSSTLNISGATRTMNGYVYRATATDCSSSVTSATAILTVNNNPDIQIQPKDSTICINAGARFTVSATGTAVAYQWQVNKGAGFINVVNNINFSGAGTNTLTIVNAPATFNNYMFRAEITGSCGSPVYSNFAELKINIPPSVILNPSGKSICEGGGPVVFSSNGSGVLDSLRWQVNTAGTWTDIRDNSIYSGTSSQQLTVANMPLTYNGNLYRLAYKAKCTTVYSNSAKLTVNANPVVDFSAIDPIKACGDVPLVINGNPTGGSGTWSTHLWTGDVGPLDNYNIQSPTFNSKVVNSYILNYKVTDSKGCYSSNNVTVMVDYPDATFIRDKSSGCTPVTVSFSKTMTGITKFWWDFGDGSPKDSVNAAPSHIFTNANPASVEYRNVNLTVRSAGGCLSTYNSTITVYPAIDASFTAKSNIVCSGNTIVLTAATPGASKYFWEFGDGASGYSTTESTSHLFTNLTTVPAVYTIRLTTTSFYNCVDVKTLDITVMPVPKPGFSGVPVVQIFNVAGNPVTFTNETNAGTWSWLWKFGDKSTSAVQNPVHTYTKLGDYEVTLIVNNSNCTDSVKHIFRVLPLPPAADFDSVMSGCAPMSISLNNTSANTDMPGTTYSWSFGDGSISTAKNPTYTYQDAGNFRIELTVTGPGGTSTKSRVVDAFASPIASLQATPMKVFANDLAVRFFNLSTGADYYLWEFGDGDTSKVKEPYHKYMEEGLYDITLWAYSNNGCKDSYILSPGVQVDPAGDIRFSTVFTPNKDGPIERTDLPTNGNDYDMFFFPPIRDKVMNYKLQIFNRLGVLIFETHDINIPWNGYYKGKLCQQGVYVWYVEGKYANGAPFKKVGDVTLLH